MPSLLFFTDPARTSDPVRVIDRLPRGAGVVIRVFGAADALARGQAIRIAARRRGVQVFVGADVGLAVALKADGVHLPERLVGRPGVQRAIRRRFRLTAAAHSYPAALRAVRAGVDAVILSPVFPSRSPSAGAALGIMRFARWTRALKAPVYALGGVGVGTARRLATSGAIGLAAIDGLNDN